MGSLLTKVAPMKDKTDGDVQSTILATCDNSTPNKFLDPRSPNPFRTPISELPFNDAKPLTKAQDLTNNDNISTSTTVTPTKLKHKLLRDLGYTLDPRSPALNFDRTPINFNDSNISDDFSLAGLSLNETDVQTPVKEKEIDEFYTPVLENVKFAESKIDPRSPSIDIERTPLNLNVLLDESQDDQHIIQSDVEENEKTPTEEKIVAVVSADPVKNFIYKDENQEQPITPTMKSDNMEKVSKIRTPLSCLINTQGVDNRNDKRMKMQGKSSLARTIFKDTTHSANQNSKITNSSSKIPVLRKSLSKEIN